MISKKLVLIGDFSTGKTSLIRRFVDNSFSDDYLSTIGVKVSTKRIDLGHDAVRALIWDIEGGTPTQPMNDNYLVGAHGGIVVADILRKESIEHIVNYIDKARFRAKGIRLVVALNKVDLVAPSQAEEIRDDVRRMLNDKNVEEIFLTSAKSGEGVETMFTVLAESLLKD